MSKVSGEGCSLESYSYILGLQRKEKAKNMVDRANGWAFCPKHIYAQRFLKIYFTTSFNSLTAVRIAPVIIALCAHPVRTRIPSYKHSE